MYVFQVMKVMKNARIAYGLAPIFISLVSSIVRMYIRTMISINRQENGQFVSSDIRLGSRGDSYYEYLLKQYLQTVRTG